MTVWLQENWLIALVVVVVVLALIGWRWSRRRSRADFEPVIAPDAPKVPLTPVKPAIIMAEPARFASPEPVAVPLPVVAPAPSPLPGPAPAPVAPIEAVAPSVAIAEPARAPDNLGLLKGVGPKLVVLLGTLGVSRFDQIAAWTDADIAVIDPQLGAFQGRIARDNWTDQAGYLAKGDKAGFEAKYGALGGEL